ncbi:hypothetical protein V492_04923 [Pseudogymnoascus sp. VKM F-4246]|nr:hypothetical protein V492_04923 [Pseudogymnoascus sp. VKM F-4246]
MEGTPISNAREWLADNPSESIIAACRIFKVPESTLRLSIKRRVQNPQQRRGGQNKVLSTAQTEALKKWILKQYYLGLGATRQMVFAVVCHLRKPLPPPSQSWLTKYVRSELKEYHFITTKPIAQLRTGAQDEHTITEWFEKYFEFIHSHNIPPESIWNMDETGFRIGIPGGERVIVPRAAKELYTPSPENRTSITILETVSAVGKVIPPVLVIPGKIHMDSWYHTNLQDTALFLLSDSGFSNSELALQWLKHFAEHTAPHEKPKVLILDCHISHTNHDFVIAAAAYSIIIYTFPSHLTHVLQPLDVGIFQPYKHYHREAVLTAIRDMDITYDLCSFTRDLTWIREQTFKESTIRSAFQKAGIWPISCSIALTKLRTYSKPTPQVITQASTPKPSTFQGVEEGLQHWKTRVPEGFSSPSKESYRNWLTGTEEVIVGGRIQELDLQVVRRQVEASKKRASRSRAQLQVGSELQVGEAHELRAQKAELKALKLVTKEARVARIATNKARKLLHKAGVKAREEERARKRMVAQLIDARLPVPSELERSIPDPEALQNRLERESRLQSQLQSQVEYEYESESESGSGSRSGSGSGSDEVIIPYND